MTLLRTFKNESIDIIFNCQDEADFNDEGGESSDSDSDSDEEDEKEDEDPYGINFKMIITKPGGEKMILQCAAFDKIQIDGMRYVSPEKLVADTTLYAGPVFDHLDAELKKALYAYVADRAIDDDLALFITAYSREKEQNEYAHWLKQLADFTIENEK